MKDGKLFYIGLIVSISIIALVFGLLYLQDIRLQKSNFSLTVIFDSAQGLNEGDHVSMLGKRIGKVSKIRITISKRMISKIQNENNN